MNFVVNVQLGCVVVVTLTKPLKSHPAYENLVVLSQVKTRAESGVESRSLPNIDFDDQVLAKNGLGLVLHNSSRLSVRQ